MGVSTRLLQLSTTRRFLDGKYWDLKSPKPFARKAFVFEMPKGLKYLIMNRSRKYLLDGQEQHPIIGGTMPILI